MPRCSSKKPPSKPAEGAAAASHPVATPVRLRGQLAAVLAAVRGDGVDRWALAHLDRDRFGFEVVGVAQQLGRVRRVRDTSPRVRSAVTRIAVACGPSSLSGRLRCSRTPRSTCAVDAMPYRSTMSTSNANSTPQPSTNGSVSSTSRRPAYSPESGCTKPRELREQRRDQRAGHELGHATAAWG